MSKFENDVFSTNEFINNISVDIVYLKNLIKKNQSNLTHGQIKKLEKECESVENHFKLDKNFPLLSEFLIKHEITKIAGFENLSDFDEKTEKLKKLEKLFKKNNTPEIKEEIDKLKISRDIEKKKFSEIIKIRNDFNKSLKKNLKKQGFNFAV